LSFCDFIPDQAFDWFVWRSKRRNAVHRLFPLSKSWHEWRTETGSVSAALVPKLLLRNPKWILPFVLTFPHRTNRTMTAVVDALYGGRADLDVVV